MTRPSLPIPAQERETREGALLPCPRCGSYAEYVTKGVNSHIRCGNIYNCDCETRLGPNAWNRRPAPIPAAEDAAIDAALDAWAETEGGHYAWKEDREANFMRKCMRAAIAAYHAKRKET